MSIRTRDKWDYGISTEAAEKTLKSRKNKQKRFVPIYPNADVFRPKKPKK